MSNRPSRNITPSAGAIHTTNTEKRRTFYYSSLSIDNGTQSSKSRWKVNLGDIIAVSKCEKNQSAQEVIDSWKPNHYVKKSPGWRIGLVIALRKVITPHSIGAAGGGGGIKFECHVQWLQKSLDLEKDEMKSANLKSSYRPYNSNSKSGSQLPHVLINCPGDYGVVSMAPSQLQNEEYCIVLPVHITMKTNRDFMRNGVKEGEESKQELRFCCTKTRRRLRAGSVPSGKTILPEREPDAWIHFNRPGANENGEESDAAESNVPPLINRIPGPLQQAWKGWLQTENAIEYTVGNSNKSTDLSPKEKSEMEERMAMLGDALMRGWNQSRRERFNRFIQWKEEQQRKALADENNTDKYLDDNQDNDTQNKAPRSKTHAAKRLKANDTSRQNSSAKRKTNRATSATILAENTNTKKKRKEIRFSADTKEPSSKSLLASKADKNRSRGNLSSSSGQQRSSSSTRISKQAVGSSETLEQSAKPQRKRGRHAKIEGTNDDEIASTNTRDTHSTDTTIPTRGAGRKRKLVSIKNNTNPSDCNDNGTETTASTSKDSSGYSSVSPESVADALDNWEVDSTFAEKLSAYYTSKRKRCFRELKMSIPLADPSIRCLLDEDEVGILNQQNSNNHDLNHQQFHIKIGSVVALHYGDSKSTTNSWSPFRVPWGVAQITNIFSESDEESGQDVWKITIKWFYRYPELQSGRRTKMLQSMNKIDGLVETFESCDCSVEELLPAYIDLTSESEEFSKLPRQEQGKNGFPIIRMLCQHLERSRGKISKQSDWSYNYHTFLQNLPSSSEGISSGPYKRSLAKMPAPMKKSFNVLFESEEKICKSLDIVPETTDAPYMHKGIKYFNSICMNVRKKHLDPSLRAKASNRWTIVVGRIIAVQSQHGPGKSRSYPFQKQWCPAQIVALYRNECGLWMMEIRWFDRFKEVLKQHKDNLSHLNKPHVVFETEVYEHLPVADALPGRIILSSVEKKENWNITVSESNGLPLIPRLCNHMCFDEEIDTCMDWTNYDLHLPQIPPGLSRGLLLSPTNRQKKYPLSVLSRFYIKATKSRDFDPDQSYLLKCSTEESKLMRKNELLRDRFVPGNSEIEPRSHLLTSSLGGRSLEFFESVTIRSPTTYLVSPTMEMKRRKKNSFDCCVGDVVSYFDNNASTPESYSSTHHLKHPWYPFQIPWSYGQILAIFKESKDKGDGEIKIEIRRFYRLSEISDEAKEFLPMQLKGSCEEVFESNDVVSALDARCLLGTATVFLGNHKSSGNENPKDITSCRCKYFYFQAFQRLQPLFWSSLYPKGWHLGLKQRGYHQSKFIQKLHGLKELFLKKLDKGTLLDMMLNSCEKEAKEGFCVRHGKSIQSSIPRRSFYTDVALNPQWSLFHASQYFSLADSSQRKPWALHVGDIIAIKDPDNELELSTYPFTVPWFPGQILAIFDEPHSDELKSFQFEIRSLKFESSPGNRKRKLIVSYPSKIVTVSSTSLLGPITTYSADAKCETDLSSLQLHLPLSEFVTAASLKVDTERILGLSKSYTGDDKEKFKSLLRNRACKVSQPGSPSLDSKDSNKRDGTVTESESTHRPFRLDEFSMQAYYSEVKILPQYRIFRKGMYQPASIANRVKIGDTVRVRFEGPKRFPYDCNWSVAEVVAIFEKFDSKNEFDQKQKSNIVESRQKSLKVEIRWFYERQDISMSVSAEDDQSALIEVFETDHCQVVDADAVLGHIQLVENTADAKHDGIDHFLCKRFWSTKRRTLIPCSGLEGRAKRGMMYSVHGSKDDIDKSLPIQNESASRKLSENWKDSMANLVSKLTLKDASKNAYAKGEALVGRERELSQLLTFLRGAFFEDRKSAGYKSSMFLAGPPGVVSFSSFQLEVSVCIVLPPINNLPTCYYHKIRFSREKLQVSVPRLRSFDRNKRLERFQSLGLYH